MNSRQHIFDFNKEKIEHYFNVCVERGIAKPAVFVLDVRDVLAKNMAIAFSNKKTISKVLSDCNRKSMIPTVIVPVPIAVMVDILIAQEHTNMANQIAGIETDLAFPVCVISDGAKMLRYLDKPE